MQSSEHHPRLAPSSLPALAACVAFVADGHETKWTVGGTDSHGVLGKMLLGQPVELPDDLEQREGVQWAAEYIKNGASTILHVEHRLSLLDDNFNEITFGTPDAYAVTENGEGIDVWDYKSGQLRDYSEQVTCYALMAMRATGTQWARVHLLFGRFKKVFVVTITLAEASRNTLELIERVKRGGEPTPCEYCTWCARALTCSALVNRVGAVQRGREDWELVQYHSSKITEPEEMAKALRLARQVKVWCESVEFHAKEMAFTRGKELPGYRIQERAGTREVSNLQKAWQLTKLPAEKFLPLCKIGWQGLENTYAQHHQLKLAAAKRELAALLEPVTTRKPATKSLVSVSDKETE